jgi:hypothetical protein
MNFTTSIFSFQQDLDDTKVKLQKCVTFFSAYIKHLPTFIDNTMYLCRSILVRND